jgi:hypothetical protein
VPHSVVHPDEVQAAFLRRGRPIRGWLWSPGSAPPAIVVCDPSDIVCAWHCGCLGRSVLSGSVPLCVSYSRNWARCREASKLSLHESDEWAAIRERAMGALRGEDAPSDAWMGCVDSALLKWLEHHWDDSVLHEDRCSSVVEELAQAPDDGCSSVVEELAQAPDDGCSSVVEELAQAPDDGCSSAVEMAATEKAPVPRRVLRAIQGAGRVLTHSGAIAPSAVGQGGVAHQRAAWALQAWAEQPFGETSEEPPTLDLARDALVVSVAEAHWLQRVVGRVCFELLGGESLPELDATSLREVHLREWMGRRGLVARQGAAQGVDLVGYPGEFGVVHSSCWVMSSPGRQVRDLVAGVRAAGAVRKPLWVAELTPEGDVSRVTEWRH